MRLSILLLLGCLLPVSVQAQAIPPPTNPVIFCGSQAPPPAASYRLVFDNGTPETLVMDTTIASTCPTGTTHSFRIAASKFTVGQHTVKVQSINTFGTTDGPVYTVTIGVAPGPFTITALVPPSGA